MDTHTEEFPLKVAEPTADWHLPDREVIAHKPSDNAWQRILAGVFLLLGFASYLFSRQASVTEVVYTVTTAQSIVIMAIAQGVLIFIYRRQSNHVDVGTGLRRLQTKVPKDIDLPVSVEIVRQGSMTGKDTGFLWLDEGTWYFKGLQTAFRFNQQDVVPVEAWPRSITPDPANDKPPRVLPMKSRQGPLTIKLNVINPYEDYAKRKKVKGLYREMFDWLYERPRGAIESLLPPTSVHPSLLRKGLAKIEGLLAAALVILLNSAVMTGLPRAGVSTSLANFGLVAAVFVSAMLFIAVRFAWLEYRDIAVRASLSSELPNQL